MGRKIRLTESEFQSLIRRIVIETQEEMNMSSNDDMDMSYNDEMDNESDYTQMEKSDVVNVISDFFKRKLRRMDDEDIEELEDLVDNSQAEKLTEMYLSENIDDRKKGFREKAMMGAGLGMMGAGAIGAISQAMGYTDAGELMVKLHDIVQMVGGHYSGPISVGMVISGLVLALKGMVDRDLKRG
jgi:hypothetical protein